MTTPRKPRKKAQSEFERIQRGRAAEGELRELGDAFEQVRYGLLEAIAQSKQGQADVRERLYLSVQVLDEVKALLVQTAAGAQMAEHSEAMQRIMNAAPN